jgi:hypothetical protein
LKRKFQALQFGLRTSPEQAIVYITASCILHNIAIKRRDTVISDDYMAINIRDCQQQVVQGPAAPTRNDGAAVTNGLF